MPGSLDAFGACAHKESTPSTAVLYCSLLAVAYVASLYLFVPSAIRRLPRDHPTHIQFRSLACLIVSTAAIVTYPYLFCADDGIENNNSRGRIFSIGKAALLPPLDDGWFRGIFGVLLHTCILYAGATLGSVLFTYEIRNRSAPVEGQQRHQTTTTIGTIREFRFGMVPSSNERFWITMRNYCIAPLTEEIVFRGCMIPSLLATGMSPARVSLVAPLFFGIAHVHHAATRILRGERPKAVLLMTTFQFAYTSLFGAYASHAFIRVGSVLPVTLSHGYCNWMGLPDPSFYRNPRHPVHKHRMLVLAVYLVGICAFWYMFRVDALLPLRQTLPALINSE